MAAVLAIFWRRASHWVDDNIGEQKAEGEPLAARNESRKHDNKMTAEVKGLLSLVLQERKRGYPP